MGPIGKLAAVIVAGSLCLLCSPAPGRTQAHSLHQQSAAAILAGRFNDPDTSYLLLDHEGRVMAQKWDGKEQEVAIGSLIKPFVAAAYAQTHRTYPAFRCLGGKTCWLPRGHGRMGIREAIAQSCNSYFRQLAANSKPNFSASLLNDYGLNPHTDGQQGEAAPLALARAYLRFGQRRDEPALAPIFDGMAESAVNGTAKAAGKAFGSGREDMLAKTGTAPCTHARKAPGDGFAVLLYPAERPQMLLLVRVHGHPGAIAAATAGQMLSAVSKGTE